MTEYLLHTKKKIMGYLVSQLSLQQINDTTYKKMTSNY